MIVIVICLLHLLITRSCAGSIIRVMRRLEELMRQMMQAAKANGINLAEKFQKSIELIKRDIVFADSLYLSDRPPALL